MNKKEIVERLEKARYHMIEDNNEQARYTIDALIIDLNKKAAADQRQNRIKKQIQALDNRIQKTSKDFGDLRILENKIDRLVDMKIIYQQMLIGGE